MIHIKSGDAEIAYQVLGTGPPLVLLHPFPAHHEFWLPAAQALASRYQLILPDLRGHGESCAGEGPATMEKHAADIARILDHAELGRVPLAGVSIGGYVLFEFWRRYRGRVAALALCNTKAPPDSPEAQGRTIAGCRRRAGAGDRALLREHGSKTDRADYARQSSRPGGWRPAHDAKNVSRKCCRGAARHGGTAGLGARPEDDQRPNFDCDRRRRYAHRACGSGVDAAKYCRQRTEDHPACGTLFTLGTARGSWQTAAPVLRRIM